MRTTVAEATEGCSACSSVARPVSSRADGFLHGDSMGFDIDLFKHAEQSCYQPLYIRHLQAMKSVRHTPEFACLGCALPLDEWTYRMTGTDILVFIVDDEPLILENLQHALEDAGYSVTSASSGEEALALLESKAPDFRALVTDINLPGDVTGWDIARRARELNASIPVVYMTGAAGHEWSANGVPGSVLLTKPFALAQVVTAVAQLMNAASSMIMPPAAPPA